MVIRAFVIGIIYGFDGMVWQGGLLAIALHCEDVSVFVCVCCAVCCVSDLLMVLFHNFLSCVCVCVDLFLF